MSQATAQEFLLSFLEEKGNKRLLIPEQWEVLKKYKNYMGHVCRDFYNKEHDKKMLVIERRKEEGGDGGFDLIPDENYLYYIKNETLKPLYSYATYLSNKGLTFKFALHSQLESGNVTLGTEAQSQKLCQKLYDLFVKGENNGNKVTFLIEDEMFFITNSDITFNANEIIEILELNNFKFNEKIFEIYQNGFYEKMYPDILDIKYQFPEDIGKDSDESMNTIFSEVSKGNLDEESATRIRKLLRKLTLDDLRVARKIALDLNLKQTTKIRDLFQMEIKRRKVTNFVFN